MIYNTTEGLKLTFKHNLTNGEILKAKLILTNPDGIKVEKDMLYEDENIIYYILKDNDLKYPGVYQYQVYVETGYEYKSYSKIYKLSIEKKL